MAQRVHSFFFYSLLLLLLMLQQKTKAWERFTWNVGWIWSTGETHWFAVRCNWTSCELNNSFHSSFWNPTAVVTASLFSLDSMPIRGAELCYPASLPFVHVWCSRETRDSDWERKKRTVSRLFPSDFSALIPIKLVWQHSRRRKTFFQSPCLSLHALTCSMWIRAAVDCL